ncbi:MAG: DUF99 family protein [Asgard group archaeon]|nr:DUF99 family protein [Asgard group archaeon]
MKERIKVLAIACSSFNRETQQQVPIIAVVYRGGELLEGVMQTKVEVDGEDATKKIIQLLEQTPHKQQIQMILTRGLILAGFNYIDMKILNEKTSLPIIAVVDHKPDMESIKTAIKNVSNWEKRYEKLTQITNLRQVQTSEKEQPVYVQSIGLPEKEIDRFLGKITNTGRMPEPLRVARLIATAEKYNC